MKRNYPCGWEKKKRQKARERETKRMSGSLFKFTQRESSASINEAEPQERTKSIVIETPSTSSHQGEEDLSNQEQGKIEDSGSVKETEARNVEEEEEISLILSETDSDPSEELEYVSLNFDVGNWPIPVPDDIKTEIIRRGSTNYQNLEGPFESVQKPGENPKGENRQLNKNWFYKQLPSGEKILTKWMVYSQEKKALFCFCCKLFDTNDKHDIATSSFARDSEVGGN
jgi:hypothetical protein